MSKNSHTRSGAGRPPIVIDPVQVEKLAARWMNKETIADFLGVSRATLHNKFRDQPGLEEAWQRGRATLKVNTMDWIITSAKNGDVKAQLFLAERICGLHPKALDQDAAAQADETAEHVRAALQRMIRLEHQGSSLDLEAQPVPQHDHDDDTQDSALSSSATH